MSENTLVPDGKFLLYQTEDGQSRVECRFANENLWMSQAGMAELFQTSKQNIAKHLKAIFAAGELVQDSVVNSWLTTAADGKRYRVDYYNLSAILSVGYRVRSTRGTQFRRWATTQLNEYLIKGFVMDDERLKNPETGVYFEQLLERIREFVRRKRCFGARCWTSTPPASITTLQTMRRNSFFPPSRIKCIGWPTVKRPQK